MANLKLRILGNFEVEDDACEAVTLPGGKAAALLAYLASAPGRRFGRDKLADLLWGSTDDRHARDSLRQTLCRLRRALEQLGCSNLRAERGHIYLEPGSMRIDRIDFERLSGEGTREALRKAAGLYRGPFLEGLYVREEAFEEWLRIERSTLHDGARDVLERLLDRCVAEGDLAQAICAGKRLLELDPLQEEVHKRLIRLHLALGDRVRALRQYQACRATLRAELGLNPDMETEALHSTIRAAAQLSPTAAVEVSNDKCTTECNQQQSEAYEYFLRGQEQFWTISEESLGQAKRLLNRAIELDPGFAPAYALLARAHVQDYANGWNEPGDRPLKMAKRLAEEAVKLDQLYAPAHSAVGSVCLWDREYDRAIAAYERALALAPGSAFEHTALGEVYHYIGQSETAIDWIGRGISLDPHYHNINLYFLARACFMLGRFGEAVALLRRRLIRKPDSDISHVLLAACLGQLGHIDEAKDAWARALRVNPGYSLAYRRSVLPYRNSAHFDQMVDGLRKAGLGV